MGSFLAEIRQMIIPDLGSRDGPLPPLLVSLTIVTGLVDAFSYLVLGHVFVANMTGNVVFLGFALAGAPGFSIPASLLALGAFALGALGSGWLGSAMGGRRGILLSASSAVQATFLAVGVALAALATSPVPTAYRYGLIVVLAVSMGVQNATARRLAVPDLTTTVLTLTIVGIAADSGIVGGQGGSKAGRRLISIIAILVGGLVGAVLVVRVNMVYPLVIALVAVAGVAVATRMLASSRPAWATQSGGPADSRLRTQASTASGSGSLPGNLMCWLMPQ